MSWNKTSCASVRGAATSCACSHVTSGVFVRAREFAERAEPRGDVISDVNMPCEKKPMRYGHSEGHTEVCFDETGKFIVTCGSDGDVRIWEGLDDDDPRFITVERKSILSKGKLVTATSNNTVQIHTFPEGEPDGILTRSHKRNSRDVQQQRHQSRSWASSSCDGSVIVWNIHDQLLAVPVENKVHLYERDTWSHVTSLSDDLITQPVNVVSWSPCGKRLAAASVGGVITIWDVGSKMCLERQKHEKASHVCSVAWSPAGSELVYTDTEGCVGLLENVCEGAGQKVVLKHTENAADHQSASSWLRTLTTCLTETRTGLMDEGESPLKRRPRREEEEPEDVSPATGRVRNRAPSLDDDNSLDVELCWNRRGYNDEPENSIDIEFHDSAVHHNMHLSNSLGHNMADISQEAVLLACPGTDELSRRPGSVSGRGWAAVATSALLLRLFTTGGLQREVFSLSGRVVCVCAHGEQLCVVYHRGTGFDGEQALGVQLLSLSRRTRLILHQPLPLSPASHLSWMGFSAEGTLCSVDSAGVVRMLNRSLGNTWTPVCNTRESCKSKSDHYWVLGIHENPPQIRCIPCKGSRFPPTLPRPAVAVLNFKLPLCQTSTEKGQMEEQFWRSKLLHNHFSFLSSSGYEIDEDAQSKSLKEQQELLMKMFALSCRLHREFRCVELAQMMDQNLVTLAIKYASRSGKMGLAQRLSEIALEKDRDRDQDQDQDQGEEPEEEPRRHSEASRRRRAAQAEEEEDEEDEEEEQEMETEPKKRFNPFAKDSAAAASPEKTVLKPAAVSKGARSNPFKVSSAGSSPAQPRVTNILDNIPSRKSAPVTSSKTRKSPVLKPLAPKAKNKTQSTLLQMSSKSNKKPPSEEKREDKEKEKEKEEKPEEQKQVNSEDPAESTENRRPQTGFQLWLESHRKTILAESPELDETEIIKEAMGRFRTLSQDERLVRRTHFRPGLDQVQDSVPGRETARILHCLLVGAHSSRTALERLPTRLLNTRAHRGEIEQRGEEQEERKREEQEERKREEQEERKRENQEERKREEQEERKREEQEERKREKQEEETGSATESYLLTRCCCPTACCC
ncbi:hypothetical protein WMY93_033505 [Mugilogobius chulae]|uniref:WD repeat and HMG-box DNA-binding protein 1 n=1 Tax=Mugilogobius chulae TaxID=88201 RepID=A0AAW0MIK7_9GOBI